MERVSSWGDETLGVLSVLLGLVVEACIDMPHRWGEDAGEGREAESNVMYITTAAVVVVD